MAVNVIGSLNQQRFRTEVSVIMDQLRLAQDLMLILDDNVSLKFAEEKDSKAITYWLDFERTLAPHWEKELKRKHPPLKAIHRVDFKDISQLSQTRGLLDLRFLSGGSVMSKGTLLLSSSSSSSDENAMTQYICLPGNPNPFLKASDKLDDACGKEIDNSFDEQMTIFTMEEAMAHAGPKEPTAGNINPSPKDDTKKN